jgi:uncharacterized protein YegP (UPF0339 family)
MGKYHVSKSSNGQYYWNLRAANGERILQSELYTTKGAAIGGIASCKQNAGDEGRYKRLTAKNEQPYFTLVAGNGEVLATSEMYSSKQACEGGIASCKTNGPAAATQDDTGER